MNLKDGLLRGVSASFVMRIAGMGLAWMVSVALGRLLGVEGFGTYAFLLSIVTVLRLPATFGTPMLLVREVSAARATQNWGRMRGVSLWALRFCLMTSAPVALAVIAALVFFPRQIPDHVRPSLVWAVGLLILLPMAAIRGGVLRGLKQVVLGQAPEQIVRPAALLVILAVLWWLGGRTLTPDLAMAANVGAVFIAWLAGTILLARVWPAEARAAKPTYDGRKWAASLLPLGLGNGMYVLDGEVAVLMLGLVASPADTGVFKAASQFALFAALGYSVVNVNVSPRLASAFAKGDMARLQAVVTQGSRLSVLYCLPVAAGLIGLGWWGVPFVMGPGFEAAWAPLAILSLGHLVNAAFGSATSALNMSHNERCNTVGFAVGLAANLVLTLILTPRFGAVGAAGAMLASVTLRNVILWRYARVRLGVETGFWGRSG